MKIIDTYNVFAKEMFLEAEVDDDKIIKYKKKDGEQGEMKASSAKTMPKDHPAKMAYDKMSDSDSDDKSKGQGLSGSDFDRDGDGDVDQDDTAGDPDDSWDDEEGRAKPMGKTDADTDDDPIEPDDDKYDDETTSKISARNNPHSADAFFTNPYETIQINGKKYRPVKESKKEEKTFAEKVKENSKRFAKRK